MVPMFSKVKKTNFFFHVKAQVPILPSTLDKYEQISHIVLVFLLLTLNVAGNKFVALNSVFFEPISCYWSLSTQPAFTCSKLTVEILEQGVKYVQS